MNEEIIKEERKTLLNIVSGALFDAGIIEDKESITEESYLFGQCKLIPKRLGCYSNIPTFIKHLNKENEEIYENDLIGMEKVFELMDYMMEKRN